MRIRMRGDLQRRVQGWFRLTSECFQRGGSQEALRLLLGHGVPKVLRTPILRYHRITDHIYLGPQHGKLGKRWLAKAGITASVNLRTVHSDTDHGLTFGEYCHLPTNDGEPPTQEQLARGVDFIRRVIDNGGRVYIHCQTGLGRAPTLAAAFLISEGFSIDRARGLISSVRPFTNLTSTQLEALAVFERAFVNKT